MVVGLTLRYADYPRDHLTARVSAHQALRALPEGAHSDPRGLLLFPDLVGLEPVRYADLVKSLEPQGAFWASTEPIAPELMAQWRLKRVSPVRAVFRMLRQALPW